MILNRTSKPHYCVLISIPFVWRPTMRNFTLEHCIHPWQLRFKQPCNFWEVMWVNYFHISETACPSRAILEGNLNAMKSVYEDNAYIILTKFCFKLSGGFQEEDGFSYQHLLCPVAAILDVTSELNEESFWWPSIDHSCRIVVKKTQWFQIRRKCVTFWTNRQRDGQQMLVIEITN